MPLEAYDIKICMITGIEAECKKNIDYINYDKTENLALEIMNYNLDLGA